MRCHVFSGVFVLLFKLRQSGETSLIEKCKQKVKIEDTQVLCSALNSGKSRSKDHAIRRTDGRTDGQLLYGDRFF